MTCLEKHIIENKHNKYFLIKDFNWKLCVFVSFMYSIPYIPQIILSCHGTLPASDMKQARRQSLAAFPAFVAVLPRATSKFTSGGSLRQAPGLTVCVSGFSVSTRLTVRRGYRLRSRLWSTQHAIIIFSTVLGRCSKVVNTHLNLK